MTTQPLRLGALRVGVHPTSRTRSMSRSTAIVVTLLDVTRRARLDSAEAHAVFVLAQATATALGWRYELRGELSAQHHAETGKFSTSVVFIRGATSSDGPFEQDGLRFARAAYTAAV